MHHIPEQNLVCLIENEISHIQEMQDINRTLLTIFSGYYLSSVAISTNVGDINIIKQLDKVNPHHVFPTTLVCQSMP